MLVINVMAVLLVGSSLLAYLTLLAAGAGTPPKAVGQCALGLGVVSVAFALLEPQLWSALAASVVDAVATLLQQQTGPSRSLEQRRQSGQQLVH